MSDDFQTFIEALRDLAGNLVAQLGSVWIYVQFGVLLLAALLAWSAASWLRKRADPTTLVMGWPAPVRIVLRSLFDNLGLLLFVALAGIARGVMLAYAPPPQRFHLLAVAVSLGTAWLVIALITSLVRNQ